MIAARNLGIVEGYIPFNVPDHRGHVVTERTFRSALAPGQQVPILFSHDPALQLTTTTELWSNPAGLWFHAPVPDTTLGRQFIAARKNGHFAHCSTCTRWNDFRPSTWHGIPTENLNSCGELGEITLTGQPMQPQATNRIAGANYPDSPMSLPSDFLTANAITELLKATGELDARCTPVRLQSPAPAAPVITDPAVEEMDTALEQFSPQSRRVPQHERERRDRLAAMLTTIKNKAARGLSLTSAERERLEIVGGVVSEIDQWLRAVGAAA